MRARTLFNLVPSVLAGLVLAACHSESIAPDPTTTLVWANVPSGTTRPLRAVWGASASDIWAVGDVGSNGGAIVHYNGVSWSKVSDAFLSGIWGTSASDIWAVGCCGTTLVHYDGTTWTSVTSPTTHVLHGVWGSSPSDVWAIGAGGTILHYDGTS